MQDLSNYITLLKNISIATDIGFLICRSDGTPESVICHPELPIDINNIASTDLEKLKSNVYNYIAGNSYLDHFFITVNMPGNYTIKYKLYFVNTYVYNEEKYAVLAGSLVISESEINGMHFISMISHELKTPLTSIIGTLSLLQSGVEDELTRDKLMQIAYRNSERLLIIIDDLLSLQSIDCGRLTFTITNSNIATIINQTIATSQSYGDTYNVTFQYLEPTDIIVKCDPSRVTQMLNNLLSNAAKYSKSGDVVEVTSVVVDGMCRVSVTDKGEGIDPSFYPMVFDRYAQSENTVLHKKGGTGLGLYITKLLAEKQGGDVGFTSELGVGTTFYFTLPLSQ